MSKLSRKHVLYLFAGIAAAVCLFIAQYYLDNKYQFHGPYGNDGVLDLTEDAVRVHMLSYGWEVYYQQMLAPEDIASAVPSECVCLGEYGGFESGNGQKNPHGYATYRLTVELPPKEEMYMLEIPEIYSASRIYVNGQILWQNGNPDPGSYCPFIRTGSVTFAASGKAEIIVQASDYSHYYSGMVYPPAFGPVSAVSSLLNTRSLWRYIMCLSSLGIGLIYLVIGIKIKEKRRLSLLFASFAISFTVYACYPILHAFGTGMWSYMLEDFFFYLMLLFIAALQTYLCGIRGRLRAATMAVCGIVCLLSVIIPAFFLKDSLAAMLQYSDLIGLYKFALFGWLISTSFLAFREQKEHVLIFLTGLCVFAIALLSNIAAPMFEPVLFGWQTEIAAFLLVMLLAFSLWADIANMYAERYTLAENFRMMKRQLALQEQNYELLTAHFETIRTMKHDMRQHLRVLGELMKSKDYEGFWSYLGSISQVMEDLNTTTVCQNPAVNTILQYYVEEARNKEVPLSLKISLPDTLLIDGWELGVILGNLIENAIEASVKLPVSKRRITVHAGLSDSNLLLTVQNYYDGLFLCKNNQFFSSKHDGPGIGLSSVRNIVSKYGGEFFAEPGTDTFQTSVVLWNVAGNTSRTNESPL